MFAKTDVSHIVCPKKSIQHDGVLLWSQLLLKLVCMYEHSYWCEYTSFIMNENIFRR